MDIDETGKVLREYIFENKGINTPFGKAEYISSNNPLGQGGNGIVYLFRMNDKEIAIKFLLSGQSEKRSRFKAEFFNTNYVRNNLRNVVNMIHYGELAITGEVMVPYIIMPRYAQNLELYRQNKGTICESDFLKIAKFLLSTLKSIHTAGIIHRDIKPENILVDETGMFLLSDFGIAHYEKDAFPIDNKTKMRNRVANYLFSAPEQLDYRAKLTNAADIYSMGQILYWYAFGVTNRGVDCRRIASEYEWSIGTIYDSVIRKCLMNEPENRFQSIDEISKFIADSQKKETEIDLFDDMYTFQDAVLSAFPEFYDRVYQVRGKDNIERLFNRILSASYNAPLEYNSGIGNSQINEIRRIENDDFLIDNLQVRIECVWGMFTDCLYDDVLLLELGKVSPYVINGEEYTHVVVTEDGGIYPYEDASSGYIRLDDGVHSTKELNLQERRIDNDYRIVVIGTYLSCATLEENDHTLKELQGICRVEPNDIEHLRMEIRKHKAIEVKIRL